MGHSWTSWWSDLPPDRVVWGLNKRISNYQPKVRSPHNVALVKDLEPTDTPIRHPDPTPRSDTLTAAER